MFKSNRTNYWDYLKNRRETINIRRRLWETRQSGGENYSAEMAERIAREVVPGIAERIIREEIEKLKSGDGQIP